MDDQCASRGIPTKQGALRPPQQLNALYVYQISENAAWPGPIETVDKNPNGTFKSDVVARGANTPDSEYDATCR